MAKKRRVRRPPGSRPRRAPEPPGRAAPRRAASSRDRAPGIARSHPRKDRLTPAPKAGGSGARGPEARPVLLVILIPTPAMVAEVVTALIDLGVSGTMVESKGLTALLRDEMPIFSGLASMLPDPAASRLVLSVTTRAQAKAVLGLLEQFTAAQPRPLAFTLAIDQVVGLRSPWS